MLSQISVSGTWVLSAHLSAADAMSSVKKPWVTAFDSQINAVGWQATGLAPFTRRIEVQMLAEASDRVAADNLQVQRSVQEHSASLVSAMFPAQPVGDSVADAEGSSICLDWGNFSVLRTGDLGG